MFERINARNEKRTRMAALIMACIIVLFIFASVFFIAHEADHDCTGEDCPVCALIMQCENNLKQIGSGEAAVVTAVATALIFLTLQMHVTASAIISTPILLKTRLNY